MVVARCVVVLLMVLAPWVTDATDEKVPLSATMAHQLAGAVDSAAAMATASEQLAATLASLQSHEDTPLSVPLTSLGRVNADVRSVLHRIRDELGTLFTAGQSATLLSLIDETDSLALRKQKDLQEAVLTVPAWIEQCEAGGAGPRYEHFKTLSQEYTAVESGLKNVSEAIYKIRGERADADGFLAGLEERLNQKRSRRPGEEYEMARYLGSSLFRWDLLRTKIAHHLAVDFTSARKAGYASKAKNIDEAEKRLSTLEAELQQQTQTHKELAEQRKDLARQVRSYLKSLVLSCEAEHGEEGSISKRFNILRGRHLGVSVQAAEELARFLTGAFKQGLPALTVLLRKLLKPYATGGASLIKGELTIGETLILPQTWKAKPKVGRWWEWMRGDGHQDDAGQPMDQSEFERRFAAAKRKFSVHLSAGEPVVMVYLLWLLLEDSLGKASQEGPQEVLALPSPPAVTQV